MKIIILFLSNFIVLFHSNSFSCSPTGHDKRKLIEKNVQLELTLHPNATLLDLYKNFFQGEFGPGHMITSKDAAAKYIKEEIKNVQYYDTVLWQPVGYKELYYRINLSLIKDRKIDMEELLVAFTENREKSDKMSLSEWKDEWIFILKIIEKLNLKLQDFETDKMKIMKNLENGNIIGHHSETYLKTYHPHYRIVSKENFIKLYKMVNNKHKKS